MSIKNYDKLININFKLSYNKLRNNLLMTACLQIFKQYYTLIPFFGNHHCIILKLCCVMCYCVC